jgi:IS1 family transposase
MHVSLLVNLVLCCVLIVLLLRKRVRHWLKRVREQWERYQPRGWKPQSPKDCPHCQSGMQLEVVHNRRGVVPWSARKSKRGKPKTVDTQGYACPNRGCAYHGIRESEVHALVGYGKENGIQRLKCQACGKVFTSRWGTPLYYLKSNPQQIEMVLWFLVEGVDASVLVRYTGRSDATIARWLERMGQHSQDWHNALFRHLTLALVQMDELYTRIRATASACWVWLAIDPVSKVIPSLHVGERTRTDAFTLLHDLKQRLNPSCVPAITTDGLRSYFYAITAHFGTWFRPPRAHTNHWQPSSDLLYGQLVKRKNRRHTTFTHTRMLWGKRQPLFDRLKAAGLNTCIQTAFIERFNLTLRQGVASLSRKTWSYAQTQQHLLLHLEWFRLYYHLVRPHESLALPVAGLKSRFRPRSPAMALGLTHHVWTVKEVLHYPAPQPC